MESLLLALPALGCVLMLPAMMWMMSRMRTDEGGATAPPGPPPGAHDDEVRRLRDEVARLRSDVDADAHRRQPSDG
jgi:hypothetical protein